MVEVPYCSDKPRGMLTIKLGSEMYHCQLVPRRSLELAVEWAACPHVEQCTSQHNRATFSIKLVTGANKSHCVAKLLARSKKDSGSAVEDVVMHHAHSDDNLTDFDRNIQEFGRFRWTPVQVVVAERRHLQITLLC